MIINTTDMKNKRLNTFHGVPKKTPFGAFQRMTDLTRQEGQTTALIDCLPDDGNAIIIVSNHGMKQSIMSTTSQRRPGYPVGNLRFSSFKDWELDPSLRGRKAPVYVDNSAWYSLEENFLEQLNRIFNGNEEG